jgi:hypothetical protein
MMCWALTVNKRHAWTILAAFADTLKIPIEEIVTTNLQALLNDLRGVLIHAILCGKTKDVIDSTASISWRSVFADVLDAPVAELSMGNHIDTSKNLVDARTLQKISQRHRSQGEYHIPYLPRDNSQKCSGPQDCLSRQAQPRATCRGGPH